MLYTALLFGLISSFHCIGMCGPIAVMLPVAHNDITQKTLQIITYHLGRLTAYSMLGIFFGFLGRGLFLAGIQQKFSIVIGICIILVILIPEKKIANYNFSKPIFKIISKVKSKLGNHLKNRSFKSFYLIGLFNGFLPCSLVYVALFGAMATQEIGLGVLYMFLFGLGTIPLLTSIVFLKNFVSVSVRNKIQKVIPYVGVCIGILFILRGLGLGIPYISPSSLHLFVQQTPHCR